MWTEAQNDAIQTRDKNLLVSAAAGSGKTAVLVERIIQLITKDNVAINQMLVVTFTNAAAAEMRERIVGRLTEMIEEGNGGEFLREQINLINRSYITTIHSFCMDAVRNNFYEVNLDPNFRIADQSETALLLQESIEEMFESQYGEGHGDFIQLIEAYGTNRDDEKLKGMVLGLYKFIQSQPKPLEWLKGIVKNYEVDLAAVDDNFWIRELKGIIHKKIEMGHEMLDKALEICQDDDGPLEYTEAIQDDIDHLTSLDEALSMGIDRFFDVLSEIKHARLKAIKKDRKAVVDVASVEMVKELRKIYKDKIFKSLKNLSAEKDVERYCYEIVQLGPSVNYLVRLVEILDGAYSEKKRDKNLMDFNDLEHFAIRVLENDEICEKYKRKFRYIFVDEYQDSNIVQETIINKIKRSNNTFLVGDVKQSIYKFRLADPTLFMDKMVSYRELTQSNKRIDLSKNFRSRGEILESINYVFGSLMSKAFGDIEYDNDAKLHTGSEFLPLETCPVEINIIDKSFNAEHLDDYIKEISAAEAEAYGISKKIKQLVGKETFDKKQGHFRKIEYRDIVILMRATKRSVHVYNEIFAREGVPLYSDIDAGYFDAMEIKLFINLLRLVDNKDQDIPLLSVMRSSIGGFTSEDLIAIRLNNRHGSYYEALYSYAQDHQDRLSEKIVGFIGNLDRWHDYARYLPLSDLIWKILIETGFYYYSGAMPGGKIRQANLRLLVDRAHKFEASAVSGLFQFIAMIEKIENQSNDMGIASIIGENDNVVRLMTIHKSKGLEFPIVFLAGAGREFNMRDTYEDLLTHKNYGLGLKFVDIASRTYSHSLPQLIIKEAIQSENLYEEMRILYVALTRAVDRLFIYGTIKDTEKKVSKWQLGSSIYNLSQCRTYLDWLMSILTEHVDGIAFINGSYGNGKQWNIHRLDLSNIKLTKTEKLLNKVLFEEAINQQEKDVALMDRIDGLFSWQYGYQEQLNLPSKVTVTELKKLKEDGLLNVATKMPKLTTTPKFMESEKPLTGAEKGTIVHQVLKIIDLERVGTVEEVQDQVREMADKGVLTPRESHAVEPMVLHRFFASDLGKRMLASSEIKREAPFVLKKTINGQGVLMQGIIDGYFMENEKIVILDYKTDKKRNRDSLVLDGYISQIKMYKEAVESILKQPVKECFICFLEDGEVVRVE